MTTQPKTNLREHPHRYWWAIIALFGVMISGVSIDLNVPSLPAISKYFDVENSFAQLTITVYLFGFGIFQLLAGAVADSVGRKKPFIIAIVFYMLANFLAPFSQDIYQLLGLRFLQGVAVAFCAVSMRAIIPDLFEGLAFKKMANYMTMAWSIGPIIAPAIGGYLQAYFNWQGPFYFLVMYGGSLLLLTALFMPETISKTSPFKFAKLMSNFAHMMPHKGYLLCMFYTGMLYSMLVLFGVVCPFLVQEVLHHSPIEFGHIALLMGLAWFLGNLSNRLTLEMSSALKITICFWLMLLTAVVMLVISLYVKVNLYNIVIPIFILIYLAALIFPNYYAKSMAIFPEMVASANGLMASSMTLIAALVAAFAALLKSNTQIPLSLTYLGLVGFSLCVYYLTGKADTLEEEKNETTS